jgi:hypothetical protein
MDFLAANSNEFCADSSWILDGSLGPACTFETDIRGKEEGSIVSIVGRGPKREKKADPPRPDRRLIAIILSGLIFVGLAVNQSNSKLSTFRASYLQRKFKVNRNAC